MYLQNKGVGAQNFAVILIFIPFTTYEKISFTESASQSFTNGYSGPRSFQDFRETGPWALLFSFLSQDAFDRMADKVEEARTRWESESSEIQERNKQLLLEFGLNPLEI